MKAAWREEDFHQIQRKVTRMTIEWTKAWCRRPLFTWSFGAWLGFARTNHASSSLAFHISTKPSVTKPPIRKGLAAPGVSPIYYGFEAWQTAHLNSVKAECRGSWELLRRVGAV